ncbi:hypothetical protein P171DRAFT_114447 [Karstenula rhodostoma CBS 690.94]|uniref:Uncharacterized protein n=1 Tax=Karstenula rhodostoma CBS 690.94 TaxID=1392251 RepID=A0A9P4P7L5_9PLEO|nr:hypothetical protein P171DRAFT_114447 [Karstenula rhodostoma CBS 690.94]
MPLAWLLSDAAPASQTRGPLRGFALVFQTARPCLGLLANKRQLVPSRAQLAFVAHVVTWLVGTGAAAPSLLRFVPPASLQVVYQQQTTYRGPRSQLSHPDFNLFPVRHGKSAKSRPGRRCVKFPPIQAANSIRLGANAPLPQPANIVQCLLQHHLRE